MVNCRVGWTPKKFKDPPGIGFIRLIVDAIFKFLIRELNFEVND